MHEYRREYYVYILSNWTGSVLYVGVTNDLKRRVWEHKHHVHEGFTPRYNVTRLVYYETGNDVTFAIQREKELKRGSRQGKIDCVESMNSEWRDLYDDL